MLPSIKRYIVQQSTNPQDTKSFLIRNTQIKVHLIITVFITNNLNIILCANKTYFMLQKFFRNKNICKKLKLGLKNAVIDKTSTYASETWILTKGDRKQLNIFETKVYRRILGPVCDNEKIKLDNINH